MFAVSSIRPVRPVSRGLLALAILGMLLASLLPVANATPFAPRAALASHTDDPGSVTIAGDLQFELGCPGDWQPECAATHLTYDPDDTVWQDVFAVPTGSFEYKAALNNVWDESYGANTGGDNIPLGLGAGQNVKFYYSHATHWVADSVTKVIASVPGSFQSELGCPGDWQPDCLRSWLQDPDGDGTYTFATTGIPAGSYEAKVALNESWDVSFGAGGVSPGDNIPFTVPGNAKVTFSFDSVSHVLTIQSASQDPGPDNNVEWDGLRHDSRDTLYRTPGGAVPAGTPVKVRFRTFHDDVTGVKVRFYSVDRNGQQIVAMTKAASGVDCYQADLAGKSCDFWQTTLPGSWGADNLWYRFLVTDGTDTDYYGDDTAALDGGVGVTTDDPVDRSWALMLHEPGFTAPAWAKDAVIYQIFPDRFRNGRSNNDPNTGDVRYDVPVVKLGWGVLPEGYCRNYADTNATTCPARFGGTSPEQPQGRDYMGGDLKGVDQQLDYLNALGVNTVYFNPIFDAGSNHAYDTQDYRTVDPYFGTQKDWENLAKHASDKGIRIVLDGVFNHLSSDSPFFDRYHHYATVGACESTSSPFRSWFSFHEVGQGNGTCAGTGGSDVGQLRRLVRLRLDPGDQQGGVEHVRLAVLPHRLRRDRQALAPGRCVRLAHGRLRRRIVPRRLLGDLQGGRQGDQAERAHDQRDVAEGLDAAADAARRPPRHDDELPVPGRGHRVPGARRVRRQGVRRQRARDPGVRLPGQARVHPRGLPRRGLLLRDEPARQP